MAEVMIGSNKRFGEKRVNLAGNRQALPLMEKTERFPLGVKGLVPVVTMKRGGTKETFYAFRDEEDEPALKSALDVVNSLLDDACDLCSHVFGSIDGALVTVPAQGWGFTRVEYRPFDSRGNENDEPVRLTIETSDQPGSAESLEAVLHYDATGSVVRAWLDETARNGRTYRVTATRANGEMRVEKVEENSPSGSSRLLYKRRK